ncbi:hypothetical protein [Gluconacetobacter diazotrophicus]|uniref:hypothetical protein n=1 Tax=Gluconacetobacter diazotrophicus TaxID=33996 RepID=UPI000681788F|nr:hypothetical protein [Gluconacetobacter diazotrophicus]
MFHPSRPELFLLAATMAGTLCLASCNLVDQRTFDPRASRAPRPHYPPPPPAPKPVPPLVEIRHGTPPEQWQPALKGAVTRAMARKPNVLFVVTVIVPSGRRRRRKAPPWPARRPRTGSRCLLRSWRTAPGRHRWK